MSKHPWQELDTILNEPGSVEDPTHGVGTVAEPLPDDDANNNDMEDEIE